jgi:hypothetical protein
MPKNGSLNFRPSKSRDKIQQQQKLVKKFKKFQSLQIVVASTKTTCCRSFFQSAHKNDFFFIV